MKGKTWWWILGAVVVVVVLLLVWWMMGPKETNEIPTGMATTTGTTSTTGTLPASPTAQTKPLPVTVLKGNIGTVLSTIPDGSRFASLLASTGVASTLNGAGPYTVFIPTNESVARLPSGMTAAQTKRLVQYHIVSGKSINLDTQQTGNVIAFSNDALNFSKGASDKIVRINSSVAIQKFSASNGTIYLIDQVLMPPDINAPR